MAPTYRDLGVDKLRERAERARARLRRCALCPRECRVDRLAGELGECRTGALARVASHGPHFGEEAPLVGRGGSGTIFFAGCNLACVFCQNHDISRPAGDRALRITRRGAGSGRAATATDQGAANAAPRPASSAARAAPQSPAPQPASAAPGAGHDGANVDQRPSAPPVPRPSASPPAASARPRWEKPPERIAQMMLELQALGCENINFVSPSHVVPQILAALVVAVDGGLRLPLVYNTGGYDAPATLRLLDGVVDIYMPDMKYADASTGQRLSGVADYPARNRAAILEMHRQVGDLVLDERGVARRGLLVRHLVLPGGLAGTAEAARFIATEVSPDTYVNIMDQYHPAHLAVGWPAHEAGRYPGISRPLTAPEYESAVEAGIAAGLRRLDGWDG
jgi:uncharacterized Fe-S radical SAM superfamily protein PflX